MGQLKNWKQLRALIDNKKLGTSDEPSWDGARYVSEGDYNIHSVVQFLINDKTKIDHDILQKEVITQAYIPPSTYDVENEWIPDDPQDQDSPGHYGTVTRSTGDTYVNESQGRLSSLLYTYFKNHPQEGVGNKKQSNKIYEITVSAFSDNIEAQTQAILTLEQLNKVTLSEEEKNANSAQAAEIQKELVGLEEQRAAMLKELQDIRTEDKKLPKKGRDIPAYTKAIITLNKIEGEISTLNAAASKPENQENPYAMQALLNELAYIKDDVGDLGVTQEQTINAQQKADETQLKNETEHDNEVAKVATFRAATAQIRDSITENKNNKSGLMTVDKTHPLIQLNKLVRSSQDEVPKAIMARNEGGTKYSLRTQNASDKNSYNSEIDPKHEREFEQLLDWMARVQEHLAKKPHDLEQVNAFNDLVKAVKESPIPAVHLSNPQSSALNNLGPIQHVPKASLADRIKKKAEQAGDAASGLRDKAMNKNRGVFTHFTSTKQQDRKPSDPGQSSGQQVEAPKTKKPGAR